MSQDLRPRTGVTNGFLWGNRAADWADVQERTYREVHEAVLDRIGVTSRTRYLDAGCGAGMAVQIAASRGADVSGIDAAAALLDIARQRTPAGDFRQGDLEELPFDDECFDVVTAFNSLQYAGNPVVALREARRVTRPSGVLAVVTWGNPDLMPAASVVTALSQLLPSPPPGAPGPFALSDESALRSVASDAGLTPLEVIEINNPFVYPDETTAIRGWNSSGVAVRAMQHSGHQAVAQAHRDAIRPFRRQDGSYHIAATFYCLLSQP